MKYLDCGYVDIQEYGCKGLIGESIILCSICNEIIGEMEDCKDFIDKEKYNTCMQEKYLEYQHELYEDWSRSQ